MSANYTFGADTSAFNIAVQGMGKQVDGVSGQVTRSFANIGAAMGSYLTVGAIVGFGRSVTQLAEEITTLSQVAGVSGEKLQSLAFGAKTVQVSQEKLADILKDVNAKFGEYLQTGAGPLADFFEKIAPKIGITADAFKNLTSAEVLELYVSSLQKANVSQAEMTFYMEAIASDSTKLIPLLSNNAKAWKELEEQAKGSLQVMSDSAREKLKEDGQWWGTFWRGVKTVGAEAIADLSQIKDDIGSAVIDQVKDLNDLLKAVNDGSQTVVYGMGQTFKVAKDTAGAMESVSTNTENATENVIRLGDKMVLLPKGPEAAAEAIKVVAAEADTLANALNDFFGELDAKADALSQKAQTQKNYLDAQKKEIERIQAQNAQAPELINIGGGKSDPSTPDASAAPTGTESDPVIVQPAKAAAAGGGFMASSVLPGGSAAGLDLTSIMRLLQRLDTLDARRQTGPRNARNQDVVDAMYTSQTQADRRELQREANLRLAMEGKDPIGSAGNAKLALSSLHRSTGSDAALISQATEQTALLRRMIQLQETQLRKIS